MGRLALFALGALLLCASAAHAQADARPTLFYIGDSTVRNGSGTGGNGQWGWGDQTAEYFDTTRVRLRNRALGGRSTRTYLTGGQWDGVLRELKRGDVVIMQFGHNDGGAINDTSRARGSIRGIGEESQEIDNLLTKQREVVHSYGWYLRKFIADARERGAIPIVASPVPRNRWTDGRVNRESGTYAGWARQVAEAEEVPFLDLNEIIAREYEKMDTASVGTLFVPDRTHTTLAGAKFGARMVIAALKGLPQNPLAPYLSAAAASIPGVAPPAPAGIAFQHHYISTTFPRLNGLGQSTVGDFDRDGRLDFLMGQHFGTREKQQFLFINNGTHENWPFHVVTTDNTGDGGTNALDVDGDGWLDVISSGSWFRNSRSPATTPFTKYVYDETAYGGHDMLVADVDGDGREDVVVNTDKGAQNGGENGLFWYRIPADPTQKWVKTRIGDHVHSGMWPAGIGDIDGDGDLDVFTRAWYENVDGKGARWTKHDNVGFGRRGNFGFSQQSALVDVDRDGDNDIVHGESDFFRGAQIQWSENVDGKGGSWAAHPLPMNGDSAGDFHSVAAADFDGDGDVDVFAAESEWMATRARWFIWENLDGRGARFERHTILEGLGAHNAIVGDMDGDGDLDIVNKEFAPARWNRLGGGQHADLLENRSTPGPRAGTSAAQP